MTSKLARIALRSSIVSLSLHTTVTAADGVWTNPAGGPWATAGNWNGGTIADGGSALADFSTLDIAANATVTLDGARTIGRLRFADATTASNDWTLAPGTGGALTLDGTTKPEIAVNSRVSNISLELAGGKGFTKTGAGTLSLSGGNTFTGTLQVAAGTLKAASATALGAGGAGNETIVASGATFDVNGSALTATEIITIAGSGVDGAGALVNTGAGQQNALNKVVLSGNASAGGNNRFDIRPGTTPTLDLAGFTLTKVGVNQFSMVGTTITPGNIVINNGTFSIETSSAVDANGSITINGPGILGLYGNGENLLLRPIVSNSGTIQNLGADANVNSPISIATGTALTLTGGNTTTLRGVISGGGSLLKTGGGTFGFTQGNTFTGKTTATAGYLGMMGEGVLGPAPATFQADQLTLDGGGIYTVAGGFFIPNGGPNFAGTRGITLGANGGWVESYGHADARSRVGVSSAITGPGKLTKGGGGVLELLSANTYEGGTTINDGPALTDAVALAAIQIGNYGALSTGPVTFANGGQINGLRFLASGTLANDITLSTNTASRTRFVADAGVVAVINGFVGGGAAGSQLQFGGGAGTVVLNADNDYLSDTVVNGGRLLVNGDQPNTFATVQAGGAIGGTGSVLMLTLEEGSKLIATNPPINSTLGVFANKTDKGVGIIVPASSFTPGAKSVAVVAYGDDVEGLAPELGNFDISGYRGASLVDDTANNVIKLNYTNTALTWSGTQTIWDVATTGSWLEGNGLFYQGDAVTFNEPAAATDVALTGQLAPSTVTVNNSTNAYTFNATAGSIVTGSLTKSGTGMLVLNGANSYAGGTTINGGIVSISGTAGAFGGSSGALGSGPVAINTGGQLKLWVNNNATSYYSNAITLDGGRIFSEDGVNVLKGGVTLAAGGGRLGAKWDGKNLVVDSLVSGAGKLTIDREASGQGGPSVVLAQANTYTGGTDISAGFLRVANSDGALSSGTLTFTGNGTLATAVNGNARNIPNAVVINSGVIGSLDGGQYPLTLSGEISGPGTLQSTSSGLIVLSGTNTYTGGTNFTGTGLMRLDSPGALGTTGTLSFTGGIMQASAANTADYSARFSAAANQQYKIDTNGQTVTWASPLTSTGGSLQKYGAGTLILTGANTYTGGTHFKAGVVEVGLISDTGATPLGTLSTAAASYVSMDGGTLRYTGAADVTTARYLWSDQLSATFDVTTPGTTLSFTSTGGTINKPFTKTGAGNLVIADAIEGAGSTVTVTGGSLTLSGTNTYTGDTAVGSGSLTLATASLPDAANVRINTGGTLNLTHAATDDVRQLFIDGAQQAAGTWGGLASTATNKTARITGTGILNVLTGPSANAYDSWATAAGLTAANNGKTVDADNDGLDNITEFALDGAPLSGLQGGKVVSKLATIGGQQVMTLTLPVRNGAAFTGTTTLVSGAVDGVIYSIQGTATLSGFPLQVQEVTGADATALQGSLNLPAVSTGWSYRSFRLAGDASTAAKGFLRAVITQG